MTTITTIEDINKLPNVDIKYVGQAKRNDWDCDAWIVCCGADAFEFYTGLGHRKNNRPVKPKVADFMHSILLDSEALDMSFTVWCASFGYSDDSLQALDTYRDCCKNAKKLKKHFSSSQLASMSELLQDY
jgi:hypothetical protein